MSNSNCGGCSDTLSRLCYLIDDSLRQFTDSEHVALTEEQERQLLISLSKVLNQIRSWTTELDISERQSSSNGGENFDSQSAEHECLTSIVVNLVSFLNVKNQYVQHLVGNIFLAISEFLAAHGSSDWGNFIHLLCNCFEFALCNTFAYPIQSSISGAHSSKSTVWLTSFVKSKLNNATWNCMAGIMGILRGITKLLKGECDEELVGILLNSFSDSLLKVRWDLLNGINDDSSKDCRTFPREHALLLTNTAETEAKILFLGYLVQLLCSLVELTGSVEAESSSHSKFVILDNVCDLIPRLLHWCLGKEWSCRNRHIRPYFQHKILMLMIRLSYRMQPDFLRFVRWLKLLQEYYQNLLSRPMSQLECNQDGTLEDTPFLLSLSVQEVHLSLHHLQRQAVFLFVRCSLTLIDMRLRNPTGDFNCNCTRENSFAYDSNAIKDCCAGKKGMLELYGWLQVQVPSNMFTKDEMYQDKCIKFASSFIRLYKNEDDLLFEVLLQMFTVSLWAERLSLKERTTCQDAEDNILFHISNLFSPLLLFHVFLAELQYDHQLLLDYLISKDTGSKCAEYLLRSLRTVCDSWKLFVEFPVRERVWQQSCKRKKVFHGDSYEDRSADPLQSGLALLSEQHQEEQEQGRKFFIRSPQVEDAKACLLSLKSSLRKFHKRNLFPYNPEVLIRRLTRFEELCDQHV